MSIVPNNHTYFFVHVMKTGGTAFIGRCQQNFYSHQILGYREEGDPRPPDARVFLDARRMKEAVEHGPRRFRLLCGHVAPAAAPAVAPRAKTITILRHPVDRVVSALRQAATLFPEHRGRPLEEIYEDPWFRPRLFENHQLKLFAMTEEEALAPAASPPSCSDPLEEVRADRLARLAPRVRALRSGSSGSHGFVDLLLAASGARTAREMFERNGSQFLTPIELDDTRLELALERLSTMDVFGFQEAMPELLEQMSSRYGWSFYDVPPANVSPTEGLPAPRALRRRIASDSAAAIDFYQRARRRYDRRLRRLRSTVVTP